MPRAALVFAFIGAISYWSTAPAWGALEPVRVVNCFDGDTCRVLRAGESESIAVRLAGIDAPEIHARCPEEKRLALAARDRLRALVDPPAEVHLEITGYDRKWHRPVGRLLVNGQNAADTLIAEGLARPYAGGHRQGWCG